MKKLDEPVFIMFGTAHMAAIGLLCLLVLLLFIFRKKFAHSKIERFFAVSLLIMDIGYHTWMVLTDRWSLSHSLPLELCSIAILMTILLLWTGNKKLYDFVFFAGIGGAIQAFGTPVLDVGFPHFRFFHFFYSHSGIILTALYFTWVKGYQPTFKGVIRTMVVLNILLPFIFIVNKLFDANYMFLRMKPASGSLLDYLGPYPWYILSLEAVAFTVFMILWLLFRNWRTAGKVT